MFESFLNPIFNPLLNVPGIVAIAVISLIVSLITILIYKFTTDQNLMKQLKEELNAFQKEMKELKDHPDKAMEVQKKAMATNSKYMMQSMKPTLFTFLPIIIIFGWLNAHLAFMPLEVGQEFPITVIFDKGVYGNMSIDLPSQLSLLSEKTRTIENGQLSWLMKANETGEYLVEFSSNNKIYNTNVLITDKQGYYAPVSKAVNDKTVKSINIGNKKNIMLDLGFLKLDWLWSYILISLVASMLLRKWMKVY